MPPAGQTISSTARSWECHLVGQQPLLWARDQIVEHVLHPAPTTQVDQAASELELVVETGADQEDDEVMTRQVIVMPPSTGSV
jgi:hypothetical protein